MGEIGLYEGFPVRFDNVDPNCTTFDEREYCQLVQRDDPLSIAWQGKEIGSNVVVCSTFATEACVNTSWNAFNKGWGLTEADHTICVGSEGGLATVLNTITQTGIINALGLWKITVKIPGYPYPAPTTSYAGTFTVKAGNITSAVTTVAPGTYDFYLDVTVIGDLSIIPNAAIMCLLEVTAVRICDDYVIKITDLNGNEQLSTSLLIQRFNDIFYYKQPNWNEFGLANGCYKICIVEGCTSDESEMVNTGNFSGAGSWTVGADFAIGAGVATRSVGAIDGLSQIIDFLPNRTYIITLDVNSVASGSGQVYLGGDAAGDLAGSFSSAGSYAFVITTDSTPVNFIYITAVTAGSAFVIDNVSVRLAEEHCSGCYSLATTHPCTKLLSWTNDDDAFSIPYSSIVFTNYLRLIALIEKPRYPQEIDRFAFSNGERKILYSTSEKIWKLMFDYAPEYIHDAVALAKIHDHFYIDGVEYICTSDEYQPEWRDRNKIAQGTIEVQKVIDNNKNKNC